MMSRQRTVDTAAKNERCHNMTSEQAFLFIYISLTDSSRDFLVKGERDNVYENKRRENFSTRFLILISRKKRRRHDRRGATCMLLKHENKRRQQGER